MGVGRTPMTRPAFQVRYLDAVEYTVNPEPGLLRVRVFSFSFFASSVVYKMH